MRKCIQRKREEAAAMGRCVDIALTKDEAAAIERKHYKQFKKLLIQVRGISQLLASTTSDTHVSLYFHVLPCLVCAGNQVADA